MNVRRRLDVMKEIEAANRRHVEEWKREQAERRITGVLVDVTVGTVAKVTVEKSLESYYRILNCRCIDIVRRGIGGRRFDVICDDEALFTDSPRASMVNADGKMMLAGNLFVVQTDGADDLQSLTEDEIRHVLLQSRWYISPASRDIRLILSNGTY